MIRWLEFCLIASFLFVFCLFLSVMYFFFLLIADYLFFLLRITIPRNEGSQRVDLWQSCWYHKCSDSNKVCMSLCRTWISPATPSCSRSPLRRSWKSSGCSSKPSRRLRKSRCRSWRIEAFLFPKRITWTSTKAASLLFLLFLFLMSLFNNLDRTDNLYLLIWG